MTFWLDGLYCCKWTTLSIVARGVVWVGEVCPNGSMSESGEEEDEEEEGSARPPFHSSRQ